MADDAFYRFVPTLDFPDEKHPLAPREPEGGTSVDDDGTGEVDWYIYTDRLNTVHERIEERIAAMYLDKQSLFKRLGWPSSTGYDRLKSPETIIAADAECLARVLQASPEYLRGDVNSPAVRFRFGEFPRDVTEAYSKLGQEDRNLVNSLIRRLAGYEMPCTDLSSVWPASCCVPTGC